MPPKKGPPGGSGGVPPKPKKRSASEKAKFIWAELMQESGGDYQAVNDSSGALGGWQVMPDNVAPWLAQAHQKPMTNQQFLNNDAAQRAVANTILGGYYDQYGAAGAAAMWYSGQPDPSQTYGDPPVYQYVNSVLAYMKLPETAAITGGLTGSSTFGVPAPSGKADSWSPIIRKSADQLTRSTKAYDAGTKSIRAITRRR